MPDLESTTKKTAAASAKPGVPVRRKTTYIPTRPAASKPASPAPPPDPETETRVALQRSMKEHSKGLQAIKTFATGILSGNAIYHAAYAAEKYSAESVERVVTKLYRECALDPADIPHASEADKRYGFDAAKAALDLGFRRSDIPFAAGCFSLWGTLPEGIGALKKIVELLKRVRVDLHEADLRYAALTYKNLDAEMLERALRDRHNKNEREPWLRGPSIPIVAFCYRLAAPHTGTAIDDCRRRGTRRERIGYEVLASVGRKFRRDLSPPSWLQ